MSSDPDLDRKLIEAYEHWKSLHPDAQRSHDNRVRIIGEMMRQSGVKPEDHPWRPEFDGNKKA